MDSFTGSNLAFSRFADIGAVVNIEYVGRQSFIFVSSNADGILVRVMAERELRAWKKILKLLLGEPVYSVVERKVQEELSREES